MIDLMKLDNFSDIKVREIFSYQNKIFLSINFIPIFKNAWFLEKKLIERKSEISEEDENEFDEDMDNFHNLEPRKQLDTINLVQIVTTNNETELIKFG